MIMHYLEIAWLFVSEHTLFFVELILAVIILMSLFIIKRQKPKPSLRIVPAPQENKKSSPITITSQDIRAIAGDDVITTQLDLARAYIEIGKKKLAKKILDHVMQHGNVNQQQAAQHLMMAL